MVVVALEVKTKEEMERLIKCQPFYFAGRRLELLTKKKEEDLENTLTLLNIDESAQFEHITQFFSKVGEIVEGRFEFPQGKRNFTIRFREPIDVKKVMSDNKLKILFGKNLRYQVAKRHSEGKEK